MSWNETLYRLHEAVGGEFFGSARPEEDTERPAPDAVLVLPWRSTRLVVCSGKEPVYRGVVTWTRVIFQAELSQAAALTLRPQGVLDKGLGLLEQIGKDREERTADSWEPEGYELETTNRSFARRMLRSPVLRQQLQRAREKAPARLPLHILIQPVRHVEQADTLRPTLHTVETRTDLFPRFSDVLRPRPEDDLLLLERLVEAGKAACDAAADVRL